MRIISLGDSLTYGFGVHRGSDWVSLAGKVTGHELINKGVSGDTTGGMLARFETDVLALRPGAVIIMGGGNDILTSGSDVAARSNMAAMVQRASITGIAPIVGIPIPTDPPHVREDWRELTDFEEANRKLFVYSEWLRKYCRIFGIPVVDFATLFEKTGAAPDGLYCDGMHPSPERHAAMAALLRDRLEAIGLAKE